MNGTDTPTWMTEDSIRVLRVRKLHRPFRLYEECDHDEHPDDADVIECDDFTTCEDGYLHEICTACCTSDAYGTREQTEECAGAHRHHVSKPRCATIAALDEPVAEVATSA